MTVPFPAEVRSRAIELYLTGASFPAITAETGVEASTVRKWIKRQWPDPVGRPTRRSGAPSKYTAELKARAVRMREEGRSYCEISGATGAPEDTIRKWVSRSRPGLVNQPVAVLASPVGIPPEPWEVHARCCDVGPEVFFPAQGQSVKPAKAICGMCSVRKECLAKALRSRTEWGIWGGLTWPERKRLLKREAERAG